MGDPRRLNDAFQFLEGCAVKLVFFANPDELDPLGFDGLVVVVDGFCSVERIAPCNVFGLHEAAELSDYGFQFTCDRTDGDLYVVHRWTDFYHFGSFLWQRADLATYEENPTADCRRQLKYDSEINNIRDLKEFRAPCLEM
ncbi:hypothetical protein ACCS77_34575 [Rhizobium johnstonii]